MKIKNVYRIFNILFPLIIGLGVYLFINPDNYICSFFSRFVVLPKFGLSSPFIEFVNNWGCDFLWAYSFTSVIYELFCSFKFSWLITGLLSISLGVFMELLQYFDVVGGTFDVWDIIIEIIAVVISVLIIKFIFQEERL